MERAAGDGMVLMRVLIRSLEGHRGVFRVLDDRGKGE
jgi:hypothetical protein